MSKTKTVNKESAQEKLGKCYISAQASSVLNGGEGMGESFWINILGKNKAEVRNNCMCGLCVGDVIQFKTYKADGVFHRLEFVKVISRKSQLYRLKYSFSGIESEQSSFPDNVQEFIWKIEKKNCRFEGIVKGFASVSRPMEMTEEEFFSLINSGPMTFTQDSKDPRFS